MSFKYIQVIADTIGKLEWTAMVFTEIQMTAENRVKWRVDNHGLHRNTGNSRKWSKMGSERPCLSQKYSYQQKIA